MPLFYWPTECQKNEFIIEQLASTKYDIRWHETRFDIWKDMSDIKSDVMSDVISQLKNL